MSRRLNLEVISAEGKAELYKLQKEQDKRMQNGRERIIPAVTRSIIRQHVKRMPR